MRITKISLKNFRAFYAEHEIDLGKKGNNLLVYGENGSGKSSLLKAIELFLDSHVRDIDFATHKNFFVSETEVGHVKICTRSNPNQKEDTYEWSNSARETDHPIILDASKTKGCLDYKALLQVYFLNPENCEVNLFNLLINTILKNSINPLTNRFFSEEWAEIQQRPIPKSKKHTRRIKEFQDAITAFNSGLASILNALKIETKEILKYFDYPIDLDFKFDGVFLDADRKCLEGNEVILRVEFQTTHFQLAHEFLNEAKLSAISLSIYLAALRINPSSDLKVLALDDVLIGLDMSNRIPVIDILKDKFSDYQIFLMTYDKEWYEILSRNFPSWKKLELYAGRGTDYEMPIFIESAQYISKAKVHLNSNDHKAAAIYLRTAFEVKIKNFARK